MWKGIEFKANYHIVLHSVAGACVMQHIFKTFEKPSKSIKVTPFHSNLLTCNRNFFHRLSSFLSSLLLFKIKIIISDELELSHNDKKKQKNLKLMNIDFTLLKLLFYQWKHILFLSFYFLLWKVLVVIKNRKKKRTPLVFPRSTGWYSRISPK